ncbi:hypothetical protein CRE_21137 [Caenorhabditis remanei]|uniref:F-box domain-containing protein n=1 Tax=Caenorhabditis remanei TaxID=31234 RepID=E3MEY0_CAERE|nr:hypothetical protein CRE_21137 [Caenorhabditis remanei]
MPSWNYLPVEIKQHVIKKLDFISRHSLKNTSHCDRLIVNSTPIQLPRVRFGYKEDKCVIVIYAGIDKFWRLEFEKYKKGVIVYKSENSWDPKDITKKVIHCTKPLQVSIMILKSLLAHNSILMNAMEWNITQNDISKGVHNRILKLLDGAKFRVTEMVMGRNQWTEVRHFMKSVCYYEEVKTLRIFCLSFDTQNLAPISACQLDQFYEGRHFYTTKLNMENNTLSVFLSNFTELTRDRYLEVEENRTSSIMFFDKTMVKAPGGIEIEGIVVESRITECGAFDYVIHKKYEEHLQYYKSLKCELGPFCKRCSDPFDYWYYQNSPRRALHEPFWVEHISNNQDNEIVSQLRMAYLREGNEKKKIQKGNKKQTFETPSWGFKHVSIDRLVENINRDGQGRKRKKEKGKFKDVKASEDFRIKGSEDLSADVVEMILEDMTALQETLSESEQGEECQQSVEEVDNHPKTDFQNILLFVLAVLFPILISFGIYLISSVF